MSSHTFNISLPPALIKSADRVAQREFRSRSELIREALRRYILEENEDAWETVIDFTSFKKGGVPLRDIRSALKKLNESDRKGTH